METPLEGNAFTKAMADNDGNYEAAKKQLEGSGIKMISTGMPGVNPMTNMIQPNQFAPSPMNPTALGNLNTESITGQQVPGSFDKVLPAGMYNNAQEAIAAKTNSAMMKALGY